MDLDYDAEERAFQATVRDWLAAHFPAWLGEKVYAGRELDKSDIELWHALLASRGWLASGWPVEYGGTGWTPIQRYIFEEECCRVHAPRILPFGLSMLGPVLIEYGSAAQKAHYLPRILDGTDWWCQGYSEPGAGSDLAQLRTRAVRDGDDYVINGQKTWTTLAQHANMIFCLVRTATEGKPQAGISFLLVDLNSPGIERRPIRLLDGGREVNEVFFTDVRVSADNLVGQENDGWSIAKFLLGHERFAIVGVGFLVDAFDKLRQAACLGGSDADPLFAVRMARVEAELEALRITNLRMLTQARDTGDPGAAPSMLKIKSTQLRQEITDLTRRAMGPAAAAFATEGHPVDILPEAHAHVAAGYFNNRKMSIFGGSNEIQRDILARQLLEM